MVEATLLDRRSPVAVPTLFFGDLVPRDCRDDHDGRRSILPTLEGALHFHLVCVDTAIHSLLLHCDTALRRI
jgi:hypothetical protein